MKNANSLEVRLKRMEGFFHLPITGILSPRIIEIMQQPRCGVPGVAEFSLFPNRQNGPQSSHLQVSFASAHFGKSNIVFS